MGSTVIGKTLELNKLDIIGILVIAIGKLIPA